MSKKDNFPLLHHILHRERNLKLLATALMLSGGGAFIVLMYRTNTVRLGLVCALAAMTLMVLGFKFLYDTIVVWQPQQHPVWRQVTQNPQDIVWIYTKVVATSPYGLELTGHAVMYFKLIDRSELSISVPRKHAHTLSESLNTRLPHSTFGYSIERAQWYVADPYLLVRES